MLNRRLNGWQQNRQQIPWAKTTDSLTGHHGRRTCPVLWVRPAIIFRLLVATVTLLAHGNALAQREAKPLPGVSSGTGFVVGRNGYVLTNEHVARDCAELDVFSGEEKLGAARVVSRDSRNDLALLRIARTFPASAAFRRSAVRPGEEVVALGYPYRGLLADEANVSTGIVSALAGIGNDSSKLQISAPVQPGNSGGPLLDRAGRIIGVVVAKLDALAVARIAGDIPQNVNFAIKGELAAAFIRSAGVDPGMASEGTPDRSVADVAEAGKRLTLLLECDPAKGERARLAVQEQERRALQRIEDEKREEAQRTKQREDAEAAQRRAEEAVLERERKAKADAEAKAHQERLMAQEAEIDRVLRFSLPVVCNLGQDCRVQRTMSHGDGIDYACGTKTIRFEDGTVFEAVGESGRPVEVPVVAAAEGVVSSILLDGVEITHGGGWLTRYRGSGIDRSIRLGKAVVRGQRIGRLATSPIRSTYLPAMQFQVLRHYVSIDPFRTNSDVECKSAAISRWTTEAAQSFQYEPVVVQVAGLVGTGIADVNFDARQLVEKMPRASRMVAGFQIIGSKPGDQMFATIIDPEGGTAANVPLDAPSVRDPIVRIFVKSGWRPFLWPAGQYRIELSIARGSSEILKTVKAVTFE